MQGADAGQLGKQYGWMGGRPNNEDNSVPSEVKKACVKAQKLEASLGVQLSHSVS